MKVGIVGLSGVGKSYLVTEYLRNNNKYSTIKASTLIAQAKQTVELNKLTTAAVDLNQQALIEGFKAFCDKNEFVIIELHNVIETPTGIIYINDDVLLGLKLDAVCFLIRPPAQLLAQRLNDKSRNRRNIKLDDMAELQKEALSKFTATFCHNKTKTAVLTTNHLAGFKTFLSSII
jgi:adenylate kinase